MNSLSALTRKKSPITDIDQVTGRYPELVSSYYRELIRTAGVPFSRQVLPDIEEISPFNDSQPEDPVGEDTWSSVPNLTHRYPDRVLFLVSDRCPVYCRFCTRKRKVGRSLTVTRQTIEAGIDYIRTHPEIRDVLLSGGDPLMLSPEELTSILRELRAIGHVEVIRIGTRVPAALPAMVTPDLAAILSGFDPLYVHTHFNHPAEITPESRQACSFLADAGIPLGNQTVLLRGINDDADTLENLFRQLLTLRVRPYYLFQMDVVRGTGHFRTPLLKGIELMDELHRRTSPMSLPAFVVDMPNGGGKVFPTRATILNPGTAKQAIVTPDGEMVPYPDWEGGRDESQISDLKSQKKP